MCPSTLQPCEYLVTSPLTSHHFPSFFPLTLTATPHLCICTLQSLSFTSTLIVLLFSSRHNYQLLFYSSLSLFNYSYHHYSLHYNSYTLCLHFTILITFNYSSILHYTYSLSILTITVLCDNYTSCFPIHHYTSLYHLYLFLQSPIHFHYHCSFYILVTSCDFLFISTLHYATFTYSSTLHYNYLLIDCHTCNIINHYHQL